MKLAEAIRIAGAPYEDGMEPKPVALVCGFTPLHLETFLTAHGRVRIPAAGIKLDTGLYGDLPGNLARLQSTSPMETALLIEWSDLDPRLGFRTAGGWGIDTQNDIVSTVGQTLKRLTASLDGLAKRAVIAVSAPTLPLPPLGSTVLTQASRFELRLRQLVDDFLLNCAEFPGVRVVNQQRLDELSPPSTRNDPGLELAADFPYTLPHADALARVLVDLLFPVGSKKGLITDLDDTLWRGILGETGVDGIAWDLANHSQVHAIYQQFLSALSESGVLIGVASKNELSLVNQALSRRDLLLRPSSIFPVEAHWGPKSESVARILQAWNIGPESVVFIDDSPLELAEVRSRYPEVTAILFPRKDAAGVVQLLAQLRDLFGKPNLADEDRIRSASIQAAHQLHSESGYTPSGFLRELDADLTMDYRIDLQDARAFDLVNKTNQFNLNGRRFTHSEWAALLDQPASFTVTVSYKDKFGPLGKIAVVAGRQKAGTLEISVWVMSCRAFSRVIEYHTLERLFTHFAVDAIEFAYKSTEKNRPLREFFGRFVDLMPATETLRLTRDQFMQVSTDLPHVVHEVRHDQQEVLD